MKRCRFPFTPAASLNSRSGPDVLVAALSEAFRGDPRFADLNDPAWAACPDRSEDVPWFPVWHHLMAAMRGLRKPFAIGPNVLWGNSSAPLADQQERAIAGYAGYAAIFSLSRWYLASLEKHFVQRTGFHLLDYPLPDSWLKEPWETERTHDALVFVKGGLEEARIAAALGGRFHTPIFLKYGEYRREQLFHAARSARACFYVSREDHYPLAAVEIGLMGCPIISDERACPVAAHGLTGILTPVRERGESSPFTWAPDAAERMAAEFEAAAAMRPQDVRNATIAKHSRARCRERVAAILELNSEA